MSENRKLNAEINISVNPQDAEKAKRAAEKVEQALDNAQKSADELKKKFESIAQVGEKLSSVGTALAGIGAAITGPLLLSARGYVDAVGKAERLSKSWLDTQDRISKASQRIGRIVAQEALPFLEKAADLAEKAATFAEENPEAIAAALKIGTITAGLGAALLTAGQLATTAANVGMLYTQLAPGLAKVGTSLTGALAKLSPLLGVVGSIAGGLALGFTGFEALAKTDIGKQLGMEEGTAGRALSLVAKGLGSLVGKGDEAFLAVAQWTGVLEETGYTAEETAKKVSKAAMKLDQSKNAIDPEVWDQALDLYSNYQKGQLDVTEQYGEARVDAEENYEKSRSKIIANYNKNQAKQAADFARSLADSDKNYYADRAKSARDFGVETRRAEEDHQREMSRMREDYLIGVEDAEIARDAVALRRLTRGYEVDRRRAEEDRATEAGRQNQDYAQQLADQEEAHAAQRAERIADFERRQAEQADHLREQLTELESSHREQLQELSDALNDEKARREADFVERLTQLDAALTGERALRKKRYGEMAQDLSLFLASLGSTARLSSVAGSRSYSSRTNNSVSVNTAVNAGNASESRIAEMAAAQVRREITVALKEIR